MIEKQGTTKGLKKVLGLTSLFIITIGLVVSQTSVVSILQGAGLGGGTFFVAILIATPIAWWAMNKWLGTYNYRTPLSWWVFLLAGSGALLIALITICFQTIKAALANPVKSLRTE